MSARGNSRAPPGGQKTTLRHWILRIVIYRWVQSVFRFAMSLVGKKWFFRFHLSLTYKRFLFFPRDFLDKIFIFLRLWTTFFDVLRFSEKSRRPSSRVYRPRPLRWRCFFEIVIYSFWVIGDGKRLFVFRRIFFRGSHTLFETAWNTSTR